MIMMTVSESGRRRSAQIQAMLTLADLLDQEDLPLVTLGPIEPVLGMPKVNATLWEEKAQDLFEWARFFDAEIRSVRMDDHWTNSTRGSVDGTEIVIWVDLPFDVSAQFEAAQTAGASAS